MASKILWLNTVRVFPWGYLKSKVYANNPKTADDRNNEIRLVVAEIDHQLCEIEIKIFVKWIDIYSNLSDIIFQI